MIHEISGKSKKNHFFPKKTELPAKSVLQYTHTETQRGTVMKKVINETYQAAVVALIVGAPLFGYMLFVMKP